jgi:hypothetical protein
MFNPPRDGLIRARANGFDLETRAEGMPTLHGYAIKFGEWTRISSAFEGTFMERIAPGAATKTLAENSRNVKIMFNHGMDPSIGEKVLAAPNFTEDAVGVSYASELFDTSYNRDLVPGLEAGQYGASFKFRVVRESVDQTPTRSEFNPDGIPQRTVEELQLLEAGPVVWPAYEGATAGVRSLTGFFALETLRRGGELDALVMELVRSDPERVRALLDTSTDLGTLPEDDTESVDSDDAAPMHSHSAPDDSTVHPDASRETRNVPLYGTQTATTATAPEWFIGQ